MLMKGYPPDTDVEKTLDKHEVNEVADLPNYDK